MGRRRPCAQVVRVCKLIFVKVYFADMKIRIIQGEVHVDSFFVLEDLLEKVLEKIL